MKLVRIIPVIDGGGFTNTEAWGRILVDVELAIDAVRWPLGSHNFTIYPVQQANGVVPIKGEFIQVLKRRGWGEQKRLAGWRRTVAADEDTAADLRPGAFDAYLDNPGDGVLPFVIEWESSNIASSHRAMNKIALGLVRGELSGGLLIVPTRRLYDYLTGRVANVRELRPYFDIYEKLPIARGYFGVIAVEHDDSSFDVPPIPKGTDGWARSPNAQAAQARRLRTQRLRPGNLFS